MKISEIAIIPDTKPIQKITNQLEYLLKKVKEYNEAVLEANKTIEKYLELKKKANIEPKKSV